MLPPRYVLIGAKRWLELLAKSSRRQAEQLLRAGPQYADLTMSNYLEAYDWIEERGLLSGCGSMQSATERVFMAAVGANGVLSWTDPEDIPSPGFLPGPVLDAAHWLGIPDTEAWEQAVALGYKVDVERRSRIGALGEDAVCAFLQAAGCEIYHGSVDSDALGWDIRASCGGVTKHLEVKSTTSLVRLRIYLSRHEYEVSEADPQWALVVALITEEGCLQRLAHLKPGRLAHVVPADTGLTGRWQSCSIDLGQADLVPGVPLPADLLAADGAIAGKTEPMWWPGESD